MKYFELKKLIVVFFSFLFKISYAQTNVKVPIKYDYNNKILSISILNPFQSPIRIMVTSLDTTLNSRVSKNGAILLTEKQDTVISLTEVEHKSLLMFKVWFGDPSRKSAFSPMVLPYPRNRSYKVIQGNFGKFSHNSTSSKYALDFNLSSRDTVCAADDGYIIGVIKHHNTGGKNINFYDNANYITIYHPVSNVFSQYVHLAQDGSFVEVGEYVKKGQAIGLSGETGFSSGPHLHFNVYKANISGCESTPTTFEDGYSSIQIREGQIMSTKKR